MSCDQDAHPASNNCFMSTFGTFIFFPVNPPQHFQVNGPVGQCPFNCVRNNQLIYTIKIKNQHSKELFLSRIP